MSRKKLPRNATLTDLTNHMLTQPMPTSDDPRDCLMELGVRPTCAAAIVYGMIQKAAKGEPSAAKFLKEMNGEGSAPAEDAVTDLRSLSDAVLCRLAGIRLEDMLAGKALRGKCMTYCSEGNMVPLLSALLRAIFFWGCQRS